MASAAIRTQCAQSGMFAMNWDGGPAQYTGQLLDVLSQKGIKATFHLSTKYLTDPNIQSMVQRISSAGHLIGLTMESSLNLFQMSDDAIRGAVARQANVLASFIGYYPKLVRLAYNSYDDRVLRAVESTGAVVTVHNLETYDYTGDGGRTFNAVKLALSLVGKGQGNFICLQHDGIQQSVGVTAKIIDLVKGSGYKLVKMDECLGLGDLSKNQQELKGGDGSAALDPMSGAALPPGTPGASMGGDGADPSKSPTSPDGTPINGQSAQSPNSASHVQMASSTLTAILALVLALLVRF